MTLREFLQLQADLSRQTLDNLPPGSGGYWEGRQRAFLDTLEMVDKYFNLEPKQEEKP